MLSKNQLARRNVKTAIIREPVYFFTMILIAALMFAFNSLFFSEDVRRACETASVLAVFLGIASVLIVMITAWLIQYMMRQSLKIRSREFGLYMLFGMKGTEVFQIFRKETVFMVGMAYIPGILAGELLKQFLMVIFFHMFRTEYVLKMDFQLVTVCLTATLYLFCYLAALLKVRKQFSKMNIRQLNEMERINEADEKIFGKKKQRKRTKKWLLKGNRLFLCRAIESELYSMRKIIIFVMSLLVVSISGSAVAMMYTDYQNHQIDSEYPFDVMIYHQAPKPEFQREKDILESETGIQESHEYVIYQNGVSMMNEWLYTHLMYFGDRFISGEGAFDAEKLDADEEGYDVYYEYDTYMKVSDYNILRKMLGQKPVKLRADEYILQIKRRLEPELTNEIRSRTLLCDTKELHCKEISTVDFEQNGHNGADYVLVIPDDAANHMTPYYSVFAASIKKQAAGTVFDKLDDASSGNDGLYWGSNHSILYVSPILLKKQVETELKATLVPFIFAFAYVSIVFLCVAISFLASHLISTSESNRRRYLLLEKLGMNQTKIDTVIHEQLAVNYLIPLCMALIPGCLIANHASKGFILATGLRAVWVKYVFLSLLWILMLYIIYFILTDIFFRRNIHHRKEGKLS